jgi:hypothetical protein
VTGVQTCALPICVIRAIFVAVRRPLCTHSKADATRADYRDCGEIIERR